MILMKFIEIADRNQQSGGFPTAGAGLREVPYHLGEMRIQRRFSSHDADNASETGKRIHGTAEIIHAHHEVFFMKPAETRTVGTMMDSSVRDIDLNDLHVRRRNHGTQLPFYFFIRPRSVTTRSRIRASVSSWSITGTRRALW